MIRRVILSYLLIILISLCSSAVYAAEEPLGIQTYDKTYVDFSERSSITFGTISNPDGVELIEFGIILSENNPSAEIGDKDVRVYISEGALSTDGKYAIKLIDSGNLIESGYYTRAYLKYNKNGNIYIKYAENSVYSRLIPKVETVDLSELAGKVSEALPGDEFIIKNGTYPDSKLAISGEGRYGAPIKIYAETPGEVILNGNTSITITGKYIEVSSLRFENTRSDTNVIKLMSAYGCRVTECYFYDIFGETTSFMSCISASDISSKNRVDHNVFERTCGGFSVAVGYNENSLNFDNVVDHNYFKDVPAVSDIFPGQTNGLEQVGAGTSKTHDHITPRLIVEDNLFENIIGDKSEVICIKSSENIVRYNTFLNCSSSGPDFRNGTDCVFEGNFAINSKTGMRSYGANQTIRNNYFYNCQRGLELLTTQEGYILEEGSQYRQSRNVTVEGNVFIHPTVCGIKLGSGYNPRTGYIYIPLNTKIKNNVIVTDRAPAMIHSNSVFDDFSGNIVSLSGTGSVGTTSKGFTEKNLNLTFDGEIYIPEGIKLNKRGLKSYKDVGPINRYWEVLLKNQPDDVAESVAIPTVKPVSYKASKTSLTLIEGESYNLGNLSGRAYYSAYSVDVLSKNVTYTIQNTAIACIEENEIKALKSGNTTILADNNGAISKITLRVVPSSANSDGEIIYSNNFNNADSFITTSDDWKVTNGVLTNPDVLTSTERTVIEPTLDLSGDFHLSFDMTLKDLNNSGSVDGSVLVGYKDFSNPSYYKISFGNVSSTTDVIMRCTNTVGDCTGLINANVSENEIHKIEIKKYHKTLTVYFDGKIVGVSEVPENLSGRIGFSTTKIVEVDNLIVKKYKKDETPSQENIDITVEQTDVSEVKLMYGNTSSAVIYRIYRNDLWLTDTTSVEFVDDSIRNNTEYKYVIKAFGSDGSETARGELKYRLPDEPPSDLFQITNCKVRSGVNGAFNDNMYIVRNKGLSSVQRIYCDRVYTWGNIPEEFENAAYIMTRNEDVYFENIQSPDTEDFVKFDINKSATVYLMVAPNKIQNPPEWIIKENWQLLDYSVNSFTKIYAKHFHVNPGEKATVKTGGFLYKLPSMYSIVIKQTEEVKFLRVTDCETKTGTDGSYESGRYTVMNNGFSKGSKIYNDRVYLYDNIPVELENSAYIMTQNNDMYNEIVQDSSVSDFLRFKINKDATVYVLVQPNKSTIEPSWIKENGWELTDYSIGSFTKIYKKHYDVIPGVLKQVNIGGFHSKLPTMYTVVIKAD